MRKQVCASGFAAFAIVVSAFATGDPIEFVKNATTSTANELASAECWGGTAPTGGNDYRVSGGKHVVVGYGSSGASYSVTFQGDSLILGIVGGTKGDFWHNGATTLTIPQLVLANGLYRLYGEGQYGGPGVARRIAGAATVLSPESTPFTIHPCFTGGTTAYTLNWEMTLSGAAGTGLLVSDKGLGSASTMNVKSSNSGYLGSFEATGANLTLGIQSADSLGGTLASLDPDALVLKNGATLAPLASGIDLNAIANRGIAVDSTGGKIRVASGQTLTLGWPVSGSGTFTKTGAGDLVLSNNVSCATLAVAEGAIAAAPGTTVSVSRLSLAGGGFSVAADSGVLHAASVATDGGKIPVSLSGSASEGSSIPFLCAPAGALSIDDFAVARGTSTWGAPFTSVSVATAGGADTFSLNVLAVITPVADGNSYADTAANWSDTRVAHGDAAYLIRAESAARTFYAKSGSYSTSAEDDYVFPGDSMTLAGTVGAAWSSMKFAGVCIRPKVFTANLRLYDASQISFTKHNVDNSHTIRGTIEIHTSSDYNNWKGLFLNIPNGTTSIVESVISGTGWLFMGQGDGAVVLNGDNSGYTGSIHIYNEKTGENDRTTLRIADERNLGGNPSSPTEKALYLHTGAELHPIASVTIDDANRGIRFEGGRIRIVTDPGETTTLLSPMSGKSASMSLAGGGTTLFGTPIRDDNAAGATNRLAVTEGWLKGGSADAFESLALTFEEGGGIAVDCVTDANDPRSSYGSVITNATLYLNGTTLPVRMDPPEGRIAAGTTYPALTFLATRADEVAGKLRFTKAPGIGNWSLSRSNAVLNGASCVVFKAQYEVGTVLYVR